MMDTEKEKPLKASPGQARTGNMAQRKREQLRKFDEARRQLAEDLKRERDELARALKEVEARDRRRATNERLNNLKRMKFVIGGLLIEKLRAGNPWPLTLRLDEISNLAEQDRVLLTTLRVDLAPVKLEGDEGEGGREPDQPNVDGQI